MFGISSRLGMRAMQRISTLHNEADQMHIQRQARREKKKSSSHDDEEEEGEKK
jgi:hypothetical protein